MTMTYPRTISLGDDIIDPRDIVERVAELEGELDVPEDWPVQPIELEDEAKQHATCLTCERSWDDGVITSMTPAPSARCPFEDFHMDEDDAAELATWQAVLDDISDPEDGEPLILNSYFEEYAQQLAEDIGAIDPDASWPTNCIDWGMAADQLQSDYSCIDVGEYTYWTRG